MVEAQSAEIKSNGCQKRWGKSGKQEGAKKMGGATPPIFLSVGRTLPRLWAKSTPLLVARCILSVVTSSFSLAEGPLRGEYSEADRLAANIQRPIHAMRRVRGLHVP